MKVFTVNNKAEAKFLRRKTADFDVQKYSKKEIDELIKKMRETMNKAIGVGLSANQVGLDLRLFIAQIPENYQRLQYREIEPPKVKRQSGEIRSQKIENPSKSAFYAIFNPKIKTPLLRNKKISLEEGCLSVPGVYGEVERSERITLAGFDKNGRKIKIKAFGLLARVFQHETDHLNGILFIDKARNIQKIEIGK